jgi:hypothetical protein
MLPPRWWTASVAPAHEGSQLDQSPDARTNGSLARARTPEFGWSAPTSAVRVLGDTRQSGDLQGCAQRRRVGPARSESDNRLQMAIARLRKTLEALEGDAGQRCGRSAAVISCRSGPVSWTPTWWLQRSQILSWRGRRGRRGTNARRATADRTGRRSKDALGSARAGRVTRLSGRLSPTRPVSATRLGMRSM